MSLLGLDLGTTHLKAGLFAEDGRMLSLAIRQNQPALAQDGYSYYDPEKFWHTVEALIEDVLAGGVDVTPIPVRAIGIASMAETGLLVDQRTGAARTPLIPWFDKSATACAQRLKGIVDLKERFLKSGIRPTYKCCLAKLLWLQERDPSLLNGAIWLSAADYIAYRLAGVFATDQSLAGRTYAYDLNECEWDSGLLESLGVEAAIFPPVHPAGTPLGQVNAHSITRLCSLRDVPVSIAGHDHICAAYGGAMLTGGMEPDLVFDSIGTAESLVGALSERVLGEQEYQTGLSYGRHVAAGYMYWAGGLSTSGGSIEWLRGILGDPALTYAEMDALMIDHPLEPSGILYFPYLAGSGSPHTDMHVRGAFIGLKAEHSRAHLYQAVLEGNAYEVEVLRQAAQRGMNSSINRLVAAGGGTRNQRWMQVKADVSGCQIDVLSQPELVLFGAALLAGVGAGVYRDTEQIVQQLAPGFQLERYDPQLNRHLRYKHIFEQGYLAFQAPLRALSFDLIGE